MFDEMIATAEDFYQSLGIPYHIVNIVSGRGPRRGAVWGTSVLGKPLGWGLPCSISLPQWPGSRPMRLCQRLRCHRALTHFPAQLSLSESIPGSRSHGVSPQAWSRKAAPWPWAQRKGTSAFLQRCSVSLQAHQDGHTLRGHPTMLGPCPCCVPTVPLEGKDSLSDSSQGNWLL